MQSIQNILKENIKDFNKNQDKTLKKIQNQHPEKSEIKYDIKKQLDLNIQKLTSSKKLIEEALKELKSHNFQKNKVQIIANKFIVRKSDLEKLLTREIFKKLRTKIKEDSFEEHVISYLMKQCNDEQKAFNFIKNNLTKDISQFLPFILSDGFDQDFTGLEIGTNSSNEGDGAEHLFVAKAMIAGFNSSVVDIGSSKYDAIIEDKNGGLLKVQVKSFGRDGNFSRRGRDRGGQGIDSSNPSNKGKLVTSKNCDIFAAVNKNNSEIFIFSRHEIDNLPEKMNRKDYPQNWENWSKINESKK